MVTSRLIVALLAVIVCSKANSQEVTPTVAASPFASLEGIWQHQQIDDEFELLARMVLDAPSDKAITGKVTLSVSVTPAQPSKGISGGGYYPPGGTAPGHQQVQPGAGNPYGEPQHWSGAESPYGGGSYGSGGGYGATPKVSGRSECVIEADVRLGKAAGSLWINLSNARVDATTGTEVQCGGGTLGASMRVRQDNEDELSIKGLAGDNEWGTFARVGA